MMLISQAGVLGASRPVVRESTPVTVKPDKRNVPLGVHFNRNKKGRKRRNKHLEGSECKSDTTEKTKNLEGRANTDTQEGGENTPNSSPDELSPKSSSQAQRKRLNSSSSSSSSSFSSTSPFSTSLSSSSAPKDKKRQSKKDKEEDNEKGKDEENKKKEKQRKWDKMLKRVKVDAPSQYNGKADLDVFDRWALEVKTWKSLNKLLEKITITLLNKYVTGKASIFYMKYIANNVKQWTLRSVFEALFDYCFLKDFKSNL